MVKSFKPGYSFTPFGTDSFGVVTKFIPGKGKKSPAVVKFRYSHDELTNADKEFEYPLESFDKFQYPVSTLSESQTDFLTKVMETVHA